MEEDFDFEDSKDDLEDGIDNEKHWKSASIAIAVISVICMLIIVAIILLTPSAGDGGPLEPYSLQELFQEKVLRGRHFNGTWISDNEFLYQSADRNILIYDCHHGTVQPLTTKLNTTSKTVRSFQLSPERSFLLVAFETTPISPTTVSSPLSKTVFPCAQAPLEYFLYDLANGNLRNLAEELRPQLEKLKKQANVRDSSGSIGRGTKTSVEDTQQKCPVAIQTAQWAPRGDLIFVTRNDIYRVESASLSSASAEVERLTEDGDEATIFNGVNDYMYRDLIFSRTSALWFSKNRTNGSLGSNRNKQLMAFLQLNNSVVPYAPVTIYPEGAAGDYQKRIRYPTINSPIGEATLWVVDLSTNGQWSTTGKTPKPVKVEQPPELVSSSYFVTYVDWTADDELLVAWTARNQKRTIVGLCSPSSASNWRCQELVTLKNGLPLKQLPASIIAGTGSRRYLLCCQIPANGETAAHQLYSLDTKSKEITPYLNSENTGTSDTSTTSTSTSSTSSSSSFYRVSSMLAVDSVTSNQLVFFIGESLGSGGGDSVTINEEDMRPNVFVFSRKHGTVQCISCRLVSCHRLKNGDKRAQDSVCLDVSNVSGSIASDSDTESCLMQSAHFSPSSAFATITCLVGIVPRVYLLAFNGFRSENTLAKGSLDVVQNISLLEDNGDLETRIAAKIIPKVESFLITREVVHGASSVSSSALKYLRLKILTPADFSDSHLAKYPLVFQFGPPPLTSTAAERKSLSPGEYETDVYPDTEWAVHLVTRHGIIFGWLDGRQTIDDSTTTTDTTEPSNFGESSIEEQLDDYAAIIEYINTNLSFVRTSASCLYGSNIAGSLVLLALSSNSSPAGSFNCGLALSPVVEWRAVNTLLAEHYIDWERFGAADLSYLLRINLNHSQLNSRELFIAASTANELVPISNSLRLMRDLALDQLKGKSKAHRLIDDGNVTLPEPTPTGAHFFEALVNEKNAVDRLLEHYYRKLELFLTRFVISKT